MIAGLDRLYLRRTSTANLQFDSLDGLRGVAVLFVVLSHLGNRGLHALPGLDFAGSGKYGVYLFFVLSAFLLTFPLLERSPERIRSLRGWTAYASRRVLRIFPLYVTVLLVSYAVSEQLTTRVFIPLSGAELREHLLLRAGKSIFWTIPVEFKYYLALPVVAAAIVLVLRRRTGWVLGCGAAAVLATTLLPWDAPGPTPLELGPYLPIFLLGSLAAFVHRGLRSAVRASRSLRLGMEGLAAAAFLAVLAVVPATWNRLTATDRPLDHFHHDFALFGVLWSVFLVSEMNGAGWIRRTLSWKPLRFVGVISFSVYLWHLPVLNFLGPRLPTSPTLSAHLLLGASLGIAALSYALIERPFLNPAWARRISGGR